MRSYLKSILATLVLVMSMFTFVAKGQTGSVYPVDINVMMAPPYGTCLTDLTNSNRFIIQALLRDMSHGEKYQLLIQMRVKSQSSLNTVFLSHSKKFSIGMGKPTVVLGANTPTVSVSDFFAQDNILIGGSILNNNCLPEGSYVFCFQAFDANAYYSGQRIPISKEFSFAAFLEGGATPILFFPQDRDSIACEMPAINFQWQQPYVTSGLNTYTLQIAESNSQFDGPHIVENPGNLLIEKKGLMTTMCNIEVTSATFQPNHTYYWRVVMCDKNGTPRANYPNKGASPVYKFVYCGEKQEPEPEDPWVQQVPMAKAIGEGLDTLRIDSVSTEDLSSSMAVWFRDSMEIRSKYDGVIIEVKKKTQDTWTPFKLESKEINDTTVALSSLAYRDTFMARGQYYQLVDGNTVYAPYSDTVYFAIKHPADTLDCGAPLPDLTDCSQSGERSEFKIGDEFSANGTTVSIDSITSQTVNGSSVTITGQGHLPFPILSNFGLKVEFENIEINCDNQLKKGEVVSMYDEKTAAMIDLNNIIGKGSAGNDLEQSDASFDESGTGGSGSLNADADGNVTITDADGNKITIGKVIDLSSSSVYNNNTSLKDKNVYVKFSNPDYEHIAFDDDETKLIRKPASLSGNYRDYGGGYIIPWVATNPGRVFQIKATPSSDLKQNGYKDIKFVFPASGKHVELNVEETDGVYSVSLPGMTENIQYNVYAIARKSDKDPYENVGKLNLCCYSYKTKKVVVVPLVENLHPNAEDIKTALNKIYGKLGYTFEVEVDDNAEHIQNLEDGVELESSLFSEFSADMKKTISAYKSNIGDSYDNTAAYLFLMNKPSGEYADANGIMPQKQQFGFVFMQGASTVSSAETRTMAHELGHGLFGLDHPFIKTYGIPKGETNNLMDYTTKTPDDFLSYHEWAQIDQPVASWSLFNSDEGNMKKNDKFDIEITLFNGYDYKSSKKIDDNKACSKDFNPLVECLCHQYLYLKPGEICMLEFSINNKNINYKDLILDVNNDKINIISSNVKEGKIEVQLQSLFSESYMPITLPELQVKSANKSSLIYSLAIIPCKKMEYDIDFLSLNCTINCHFYESGPNGETDVTKSFPFENNIDYQDINRVLNSIYNPINIWFNLNPPKQTVDYTFTEFNDLNNVSFLDDDILTESERSITYYFSSLNDDNQEFNRFLDDYTTQNHTIVWLPMLIDYYAEFDGVNIKYVNTNAYAQKINNKYPLQNSKKRIIVSSRYKETTVAHEIGHSIFGLYHPFNGSPFNSNIRKCRQGEDRKNVMDYDQTEEEMGQVFLRAHDVYHIFVQSIYRRLVDLNVNDPLYEEKYKELFDNDSNIEIEE